jgi:hypothetical protein
MDPVDALVLQSAQGVGGTINPETRKGFAAQLHISQDEVDVSVINLERLGLVIDVNTQTRGVTSFGREFLRAIKD